MRQETRNDAPQIKGRERQLSPKRPAHAAEAQGESRAIAPLSWARPSGRGRGCVRRV